ncbi:MAG: hypothetical protein KAS07_02000 [Candidatus Pacebacteria bacterium]|nr:hypothetical protein [Candidatus Paceibacterota bacterium]
MKKFLKKFYVIPTGLFLFAIKARAANPPVVGAIDNPLDPTTRGSLKAVLDELFTKISELGAILLAIMIVYSGFLFVTAVGNDEKLKKAKDSIRYVIIGGAVVLGATGIAELIEQTLTGP